MDAQQAESALDEEFSKLLNDVAPDEATYASSYLRSTSQKGISENIFGAPGGGIEFLIGAWLAKLVIDVAASFIKRLKDKAVDAAATSALEWLKQRFELHKEPESASREVTLRRIQEALIAAGWSPRDALLAAEQAWSTGENMGRRLVVLAST